MKIDSIKFSGHPCFQNYPAGFDKFSPINVIIGRNNTGKSRLLDLVNASTGTELKKTGWIFECTGILQEADLKEQFSRNTSSGDLSGNHWNNHGVHFVGTDLQWTLDKSGHVSELMVRNPTTSNELTPPRETRIKSIVTSAKPPLFGKRYVHLLADRNIEPESSTTDMSLRPDGKGATNIVRRYLTSSSSKYPRSTISDVLRNALNEIFRSDGDFSEITVQLHDETADESSDKWEIYLGEKSKGIVALSASGSGLKTVFLVLLNLLVRPEIEQKSKYEYVFAFEELENNLHPSVLRRLLTYLESYALEHGSLIFLTTHSSVALDLFGPSENAQILHVSHDGQSAMAKRVSAHFDRVGVVAELGAKPSDLLQSNGIIWVEGPSDAVYMNRWIDLISNGRWQEGRDYLCAFYGGSLLARTQFVPEEEAEGELVNLFMANTNVIVMCDSDREGPGKRIKDRVSRIRKEISRIPNSLAWVTEARETENYLYAGCIQKGLGKESLRDPEQFESFFPKKKASTSYVESQLGLKSVDKIELALRTAPHMELEAMRRRFDWEKKMNEIEIRIASWNV